MRRDLMSSSITDFPRPPVHGFRGDTPTPPPLTHPRGLSVAISREAGARGATIARKVGELVGWQVFDQESLDYLIQDETARSRLLSEVPPSARAWADSHFTRLQLNQKLVSDPDTAAMIRILLAVAARGDSVIVGRGAGFLLPAESTVHVRVIAPFERRVAYFAQSLRLSREEAAAEVRARDQRRAEFLMRTMNRDPADPTGYDVVVNADRLGLEGAAQFIAWAIRIKQMFDEIRSAEDSDPAGP
jgi:cytidylate kinase